MQAIGVIGLVLVWTGAVSTFWNVAGNWNPAQVPPGGVVALRFPDGAARKVSRNNIDLSAAPPMEIQIQANGYDIAGNPVPTCGIDATYASGESVVGFDVIGHASCANVEFQVATGGVLKIAGDLPAKDLIKSAGGTVHFLIADASARSLRIAAGAAVVQSSFGGTAVTLDGGTLAGSGTVASITSTSGAVSPGGDAVLAGISTMRRAAGDGAGNLRSGNVAFNGSTTLNLELAGASSADRLTVTGTVSLGAAVLSASLGFSPATTSSTTFTVIDNDGADAVSGTFAGLAEGATFTIGGRTLRVSYAGGTGNDVTLTVLPVPVTLTISPSSLDPMTAGTAASQTIAASGGTAPYTFAVTGGTLPGGLSLSAAGALSGTPSAAGTYSVTVTATDALSNTGSRTYAGTIGSAPATVTMSPSSLPAMRVGRAMTQTFSASGGTAPYTYAVTGGTVPPGLSLSTGGVLSGTPSAQGAYAFTVTVTDSGLAAGVNTPAVASTASITYTGTIGPAVATLDVTPVSLPPFTVGTAVSTSIAAVSGAAPYTFAVTGGSLPAGLTLDTTGSLSGTPTTAGAYGFTVTATDVNGDTGVRTYSGAVAPAPVPALPFWALALLAGLMLWIVRR